MHVVGGRISLRFIFTLTKMKMIWDLRQCSGDALTHRFLDFCHHVLMASFHLRRKKSDVVESYFHFPLFSPLSSGQDLRLARPAPPLAKSCSFPVLVPRKARETNIFFFHLHNENVYCGRHVVQQASSRWGNLSPLRKQLLHENAYSFFSISKKKI